MNPVGKIARMAERDRVRQAQSTAMRESIRGLPAKRAKRARNRQAASAGKRLDREAYNARLKDYRAERERSGNLCPYERAVRRVERLTGRPRETWEFVPGNRLARVATAAARVLAGVGV